MSMSTHVKGFVPPDETWNKMKSIWNSCELAGIDPPRQVSRFFNNTEPDPRGMMVDIKSAVREYSGDMEDGYEIEIAKLPKNVKVIRVYNSY